MKIKHLFIATVVLFIAACTQQANYEPYEGKALTIAVIGEPPVVNEKNITFEKISLDDLTDKPTSYEAIFIMEEHLSKASEPQYAEVFRNTPTPIFFISANSSVPFLMKDERYGENWAWSRGTSYAFGVMRAEESMRSFGFGLYNGENTEAHRKEVYSRIFETVEEL